MSRLWSSGGVVSVQKRDSKGGQGEGGLIRQRRKVRDLRGRSFRGEPVLLLLPEWPQNEV